MTQLTYSERARDDLLEIAGYLSGKNRQAARRIINEIRDRCRAVARQPGTHSARQP